MKPDNRTAIAAIEAVRKERLRRAEEGPAFGYYLSVLESRLPNGRRVVVVSTPNAGEPAGGECARLRARAENDGGWLLDTFDESGPILPGSLEEGGDCG